MSWFSKLSALTPDWWKQYHFSQVLGFAFPNKSAKPVNSPELVIQDGLKDGVCSIGGSGSLTSIIFNVWRNGKTYKCRIAMEMDQQINRRIKNDTGFADEFGGSVNVVTVQVVRSDVMKQIYYQLFDKQGRPDWGLPLNQFKPEPVISKIRDAIMGDNDNDAEEDEEEAPSPVPSGQLVGV